MNSSDICEFRKQVPRCLGRVGTLTTLSPSAKMYFNIIIVDSFQYVISIIAAINYEVNCLCTSISSGTSKVGELHGARYIFSVLTENKCLSKISFANTNLSISLW